tara:strand:- start:180 stop:413 length:234 start_codon:yes stop_codon:yes gene_type:complete
MNPIKKIVSMPEYETLSSEMRGYIAELEFRYDKSADKRKVYAQSSTGKLALKKASVKYEEKKTVERMAKKGFIKMKL